MNRRLPGPELDMRMRRKRRQRIVQRVDFRSYAQQAGAHCSERCEQKEGSYAGVGGHFVVGFG